MTVKNIDLSPISEVPCLELFLILNAKGELLTLQGPPEIELPPRNPEASIFHPATETRIRSWLAQSPRAQDKLDSVQWHHELTIANNTLKWGELKYLGGFQGHHHLLLSFKTAQTLPCCEARAIEFFQQLIKGSHAGIWYWQNTPQEETEWWSDYYYELLGYPPQAFAPSQAAFQRLLHPEDRERIAQVANNHLLHRTPYQEEFRLKTATGSYRWFLGSGQASWDHTGKPIKMVGTVVDITLHKQKTQQLKTSQRNNLNALVSSLQGIILLIDRNLICREVWTSDESLLFASKSDLLWQPILKYMPQTLANDCKIAMQKVFETGKVQQLTYPHPHSPELWFLATMSKIKDADFISVLIQDISQQKYNENQLKTARESERRANQAKSQFVVNLSHELRTPLNAMIGLTEILNRHPELSDKSRQFTERIRVNSRHMLALINQLLDLSKVEANKMPLHYQNFALEPFLEDIQATALPLMEKHQNTFNFDISKRIPQVINQEQRILKQILLNLISNSAKYTHQGQISLNIDVSMQEHQNLLIIALEDTGVGMSEGFLKQIFKPYSQSEYTQENGIEGTGLGLTLCLKLSQLIGGTLDVTSTLNQGSCFTLRLPFSAVKNGVQMSSIRPEA